MIKFAEININYKKSSFSRIIYFDENYDTLRDNIEYEINDLIDSISRISYLPVYFIKNKIYKTYGSINVHIYTINNADNLGEKICEEKLNEFKSKPFCNNEDLCSFILEIYSNKRFYKRLLCFGNLDNYWSFRRELSDYSLKDKFYNIGDIVLIKDHKDPFIITWCNNKINNYDFSNTYDVYCIKDNNIQYTLDDNIHYSDIIKVIDHNLSLAKSIIKNSNEYTEEYIKDIMAMKEDK